MITAPIAMSRRTRLLRDNSGRARGSMRVAEPIVSAPLFLTRLGGVVGLEVRDDLLGRGLWNRRAEHADHLVHFAFPRGTRQRWLHRDVGGAVADTTEALGDVPALAVGKRKSVIGPRPDRIDRTGIVPSRCGLPSACPDSPSRTCPLR